jgi:hypothetical protein
MVAIIGICVAIAVCVLALIIVLICFCRMRIRDDTNIRKRILGRHGGGGYAQEEIKTHIIEEEAPRPIPIPYPMPIPQQQHHYIEETVAPPPPPQQPGMVVHEIVHRYEPPSQPILLPAPQPQPQAQRMVVRRSSWSDPHHHHHSDDWIMIKKKKKRGNRAREVEESDSSSEDEEVVTRQHRHGGPYMMSSLNPYDLAIPAAYQQRRPMMVGPGMGMGAATYMVGARPMMAPAVPAVYGMTQAAPMMMTSAVNTVPMMAGGASTFQPTYGFVPRM